MHGTFSVIIPVFNGAKFLPEAIESVYEQDVPSVEIIVVNDGSRDHTEQVAKSYGDEITYLSQSNLGPSAARNVGLTRAEGDYVAFLDCDDRWSPRNLSILRGALNDGGEIALGRVQEQVFDRRAQRWVDRNRPYFSLSLVAMLTRRSTFDEVGPFDEEILIGEDKDWFFRAREKRKRIAFLKEHISLYHRRHDHNTTNAMGSPEPILLDLMRQSLKRRGALRSDGP